MASALAVSTISAADHAPAAAAPLEHEGPVGIGLAGGQAAAPPRVARIHAREQHDRAAVVPCARAGQPARLVRLVVRQAHHGAATVSAVKRAHGRVHRAADIFVRKPLRRADDDLHARRVAPLRAAGQAREQQRHEQQRRDVSLSHRLASRLSAAYRGSPPGSGSPPRRRPSGGAFSPCGRWHAGCRAPRWSCAARPRARPRAPSHR